MRYLEMLKMIKKEDGEVTFFVPNTVTDIRECVCCEFYFCTKFVVDNNNPYYSSDEFGVLFNKDKTVLVKYPSGNERTSYTVPDTVVTIDNFAFYKCTSLTNITIPNSVISSGFMSFLDCENLENITISNFVLKIGHGAVDGCKSLKPEVCDAVERIIADIESQSKLSLVLLPDITY